MALTGLKKHGITKSTPSNIPLGAGTWFKGLEYSGSAWTGTVLGATSGGSSITITPELFEIPVDGALVSVKGLTVQNGGLAEAEINFAEVTGDIIQMTTLFEKKGSTTAAGFDEYTGKSTIAEGDYIPNLGFVGRTADGTKEIIVIMHNALCTSGFSIEPVNKENAVLTATFKAHQDIEGDLEAIPVTIYYPTADGASAAALSADTPSAETQTAEN